MNGEIQSEIIYQNEEVFCFLDINPTNLGHVLVIPKRHVPDIYHMDDSEIEAVARTAKMLAPMIKNAVNADGINLIMNNEPAAGQIIFHAHMHIVPRFSDDGFKHWKGKSTTPDELKAVLAKIREELIKSVA